MGFNTTTLGPIVTALASSTLIFNNLTEDDATTALNLSTSTTPYLHTGVGGVGGGVGGGGGGTNNATPQTPSHMTTTTTTPNGVGIRDPYMYTYTYTTTTTTTTPQHDTHMYLPTTEPPHYPDLYDIREVIRSGGVDYGQFGLCINWLPINHIYFQLANIFLFLSYLAPNGIYGILYLRITLTIGCMFFSLWGWVVLCAFDTFLWNAIFVLINLVHVVVICYYLRPVRFTPELEQVYRSLFQPLKVSRHQFKRVIKCMRIIRYVKFQEIYAQEKITRVDSLSLVLSGRLVISQNGRALHIVSQHQFLDSPEWFGVSTDEFFQVSATAIEDSRVLIWHRDKLKLTIMGDQFLQAVFDHILGRDVVKKLMQVNESLSGMGNGHCIANLSDESETKPLLVVKRGEESGSITAIINRQLQGDDDQTRLLGDEEEKDEERDDDDVLLVRAVVVHS